MTQPRQPSHESELAGAYDRLGVGTQRTHAVQFYEDDCFFIASVGDFLATGLAVGQRVLAVVTSNGEAICGEHTHVIPTEHYTSMANDQQFARSRRSSSAPCAGHRSGPQPRAGVLAAR